MTEWMQAALQEAEKAAEEKEVPIGAVIVHHGQIIASAHNRREQMQDPTEHAEMACLREAAAKLGRWRMNECTIYITLEPCPMCAGALLMSRMKHIVFAARDSAYGCCGSVYDLPADPAMQGQTTWQSGDGEAEAAQLLTDFFQNRRKEHKHDAE